MKCDRCKKREAHIHVTKIVNNKKIEKHLCEVCAQELGFTPADINPAGEDIMQNPFADMSGGLFDFPDLFASLFKRRPQDRIYDYFSESAQNIISLAREEAKRLSHDHLRTEHLLLGLIKDEGLPAKIMQKLGIDLVNLFSDIESLIGHGEKIPEEIVLSPRAKKVLELAYNTARELGFNYVGPEHLLLGIIREGESISAQALQKRNINFDKVVKTLLDEIQQSSLGGGGNPPEPQEPDIPEDPEDMGIEGGSMFGFPGIGIGKPPTKKPALSSFGKDLTKEARENKLDPIIDRDKEIERVIRILSRRTKNNPALLGDPGVGKTAIVEGLAERIVKGEVPDIIKDKQVISLDLAGMIAGTKYRGEFEARVKKLLDEIISKSRKIILFIDELHTLVGAGGAEGAIDAANILKPALAKGDLQVIGATTVTEYRKYIEKDPALERRFQPVNVSEPSVELTIEILKGIRDRYEAHHCVKIPDAAIIAAATLSDRYISERFLPDKAIDLMDEAAAKVHIRNLVPSSEMKILQKDLVKAQKEKEEAINNQGYEKAAQLRDKVNELRKKMRELEESWKLKKGKCDTEAAVTEDDIAEIVSDWTGIPVVKLTEAETEKLIKMEETLHKRVIGQEDAITAISQAIRRGRAGLKAPEKPVGSFIFAGPTGVGKTEVARRLAEFLFGTQEALIRLDMSEYMEKHTVSRLIGAPPGYVGYDEGGMLTEAVRRKPYSVLLFDEIEKAHPDIFNTLLQILDDGRLTDSKGHVVDFKNTVIIMTTNIGQKAVNSEGAPIGFTAQAEEEAGYDKMKQQVLDEMKHNFRPEFLNRIDEIIVFHALTKEQLKKIVNILVNDVAQNAKKRKLNLEIDDSAKDLIIEKGYDQKFGARPIRRAIQQLIENPLSNEILENKWKDGDSVLAKAEDNKIIFVAKAPKKRK